MIDLILKKIKSKNLRKRPNPRMGAAIRPSEVEVKPMDPLNQYKSPGVTDKAFDKTIGASEEARKGGRRRP